MKLLRSMHSASAHELCALRTYLLFKRGAAVLPAGARQVVHQGRGAGAPGLGADCGVVAGEIHRAERVGSLCLRRCLRGAR